MNRPVTDGERALIAHVLMWGSDGYPIQKLGKKWAWGTDAVKGPPVCFRTRREAIESFERFYDLLLSFDAAERASAI